MHPQQSSPQFEALRKQLPFELHPTNLPGAFATAAPPDDLDPHQASTAALLKHGILWKRPQRGDDPRLARVWDRVFAGKWLAKDRIVPIL